MTRKTAIGAGALVLLVGGIVLCLQLSGTPPTEVAEVLSTGGEKVLREPMRPDEARSTRVLVIALDGVGADEFERAVRSGHAPAIAGLLGASAGAAGLYEHAYAAPGVLSILPSTTVAAWSSVFTGEPPARTGVPGNEWFVREEMRYYAPAPVSVGGYEHALEVFSDALVGQALRVPTVYEQADVRSYVSLSHVHRGADLLITPDAAAFGDLVAAAAEGLASDDKVSQEAYAKLDHAAVDNLLASLRERGVPVLLTVYFPGVDLYTHVAENPLVDQHRYLRQVIDPAVAELLAEYRAQRALEVTYVLFVSDHGHTPVLADDRHSLGADGEDEPPGLIEQTGFRMRPFVLEPGEDEQDYQATVAYQGAFAYVYLADRSTCPEPGARCDWSRPPRLEEDVLPVVRAFDAANRTGAGVPALQGTLDLILAREPRAPTEDALPFQVWDGERLVDVDQYLATHPRPQLLALEERLRRLGAGPFGHRAGDVLLLARSGPERPIEARFYFSGEYRSWHSSPTAQDSRIPLVLARVGTSGSELRGRVEQAVGPAPSQLDIAPLIRALLQDGR